MSAEPVGFVDEPQPRPARTHIWALTLAVLMPAAWAAWQLGLIIGRAAVRAILAI